MAVSLPKVGILSVGEMGMGIAKLLVSKGFSVATCGKGRSQDTIARARSAEVEILQSDVDLVQSRSIVFSVAPPRDAIDIAQRIIDAAAQAKREKPLYFADLNAVSPATCKEMAAMFEKSKNPVHFVDGCIIGGPPKLKDRDGNASPIHKNNNASASAWYVPSIPTSGPHSLDSAYPELAAALGTRHISRSVGAASGLKMCFATVTKGAMALGIQAFTTASRLGVVNELRNEMRTAVPGLLEFSEKAIPIVPPKTYRWVREMEEIAATHREEGGFEADSDIFLGVAELYRLMAEDPVLGAEKVEKRIRGNTLDDIALVFGGGLAQRKALPNPTEGPKE